MTAKPRANACPRGGRWIRMVELIVTAVVLGQSAEVARGADGPPRKNVLVYKEAGRYGGWPANGGIWRWEREIVVGFTAAWYKPVTGGHAVDREKPFERWQARSMDGGSTWTTEKPAAFATREKVSPVPLPAEVDFSQPDFALAFGYENQNVGPSYFYISQDRCRQWSGPFTFAVEGIERIAARTDYLVLGPRSCLMFGSAAKANGKEGRVFCARTDDGGRSWRLASRIGPEPSGYAIMPSSVRLKDGSIFTTVRHWEPEGHASIDAYVSADVGKHWRSLGAAAPEIGGGNPPSLVLLKDGRLCLTYGYRAKPYGIRARISGDEGTSWGPEIVLRDDAPTGDLGYPRSVERPDGRVVTIYYYNGPKDDDRAIEATIWQP